MGSGQLSEVMATVSKYVPFCTECVYSLFLNCCNIFRDPAQHASLKAEIEDQSTALYATSRLWDDGIIRPQDTRDAVGLGLALAAREKRASSSVSAEGGFGVFRM